MIFESKYWKNDLLRQAKLLRQRSESKRWTDGSLARIEQSVLIGFYSIRKLIESKKLSTNIASREILLVAYPWAGKPVTRLNWHEHWELYNLEDTQIITRKLLFLCNQVIHSYIVQISIDSSNRLEGVLVTSDRERNRFLYFIKTTQIIELYEQVGNNYPNSIRMTFNPQTQDYDVHNN